MLNILLEWDGRRMACLPPEVRHTSQQALCKWSNVFLSSYDGNSEWLQYTMTTRQHLSFLACST